MGDPALERRFLRLFLEHARADLKRMAGAAAAEFAFAVHSLKSSASSVGAWHVVEYAEHILDMEHHVLHACRDEILEVLSCRVEDTIRYIHEVIDGV